MADTRQIVRWALDQTCKLRKQGEAVTPDKAFGAPPIRLAQNV